MKHLRFCRRYLIGDPRKKAGKIMKIWARSFTLVTILGFLSGGGEVLNAQELQEVKVHTSGSATVNALIFKIGEDLGFYKDEGLRVLPIVATSQAGVQGLLGGSFDYSQIIGQGSVAIFRGAPLKILMVFETKPLFWLYGRKGINTLEDLKGGKLVGVSSLGAGTDQMTREVFAKKGIDAQRDVVIQGTGTGAVRMAALLSGAIDAAVVSPSERIIAKRNGLHELAFYGDFVDTVNGGVLARERLVSERRDFVRRFLRGTLRAFLWIRSNEKEAVARITGDFKIPESEAFEIYKEGVRVHSHDGTITRDYQERVIAFQKKHVKVDKEVLPERVYDFSILQSLNEELKKAGR